MADDPRDADQDTAEPTDHVELTVQRMAELHAQHVEDQSSMQRAVADMTSRLARPTSLLIVCALAALWILGNLAAPRIGLRPLDSPPFQWVQLVGAILALCTTLMILSTQAREEVAARHRSQLTLQLASLSEQKIAKVIALLEEQRRDSAQLPSRDDPEADAMAQPSDPSRVLERIKDTHEE